MWFPRLFLENVFAWFRTTFCEEPVPVMQMTCFTDLFGVMSNNFHPFTTLLRMIVSAGKTGVGPPIAHFKSFQVDVL